MAEKTNALAKGNGFDPEAVKSFVARYDVLEATKDKLKDEHKTEIDSLKEDQKHVLEDAKREHGIPVKAFEHFLKYRAALKALQEFDADADPAVAHDSHLLQLAFGLEGTPLGDFAEGRDG